jgi:hypothetical protein
MMLLALFFTVNVKAQNEISLSVSGNEYGVTIFPATLVDGGAVEISFEPYQCADKDLSILVNGIGYPVEPYGNSLITASNGTILSNMTGGDGMLDINATVDANCDWQTGGFSFTVYLEFAGDKVYYSAEESFPPFVSVNPATFEPFGTCPDFSSASQSFSLFARNLTGNLEVKELTGYEYSTDNSVFSSSLVLTPVDGQIEQAVYVRLALGNEAGTYNGSIEYTVGGTDPLSGTAITVSGEVAEIEGINVFPASITELDYREGSGPSEAMPFVVSACLTGDITINAPVNFEISTSAASGFQSSPLTLPPTGGTVWVRLNAENRGFYSGNISIETAVEGVESKNVPVSGTVQMYDCTNHSYRLEDPKGISGTICALDECDAIFELNIETTDAYYADFGIGEKNVEGGLKLSAVSLPNGATVEYNGGKVVFRNAGLQKYILYADMRTPGSVVISTERPALTERIVIIKGETDIRKCDPLSLTVFSCPPDLVTGYRWYQNNALIEGEDQATLNIERVEKEAFYSVEVLDASGNVLGTSKVTILFEGIMDLPDLEITSTVSNFVELNELEHQINQGDKFSFNITLPETPVFDYYVLQARSLDVDSFWVDLKTIEAEGSNVSLEITAEEGMLYRLKAYNEAECSEDHFSNEVLVRVILGECRGDGEVVYSDNFGFFKNADVYVDKNNQEYTGNLNGEIIANYWAPDPDGSVVNHTYAMDDTQNYGFCDESAPHKPTGGFYRVEDGYYAILPTSGDGYGDCGEGVFWGEIKDHTLHLPDGYPDDVKTEIESEGSTYKGAMLFINVADLPGLPIYERKIPVECDGVNVMFSAYINNAVKKEGSDHPVNVRLDIFKIDPVTSEEIIVKSISSGDIRRRVEANMTEEQGYGWVRLMSQFTAEIGEYKFRLVNNAPSGTGNDLLFDDISITLCTPIVNLVVDGSETAEIVSCSLSEEFILRAKPVFEGENGELIPVNLEDYIPTPHYAFRRTNFDADGNIIDQNVLLQFEDGSYISSADSIKMLLTVKGKTVVEMIVASSAEIVQKVIDGTLTETDKCRNFFLRDTIEINFHPYEPSPIDTIVCPDELIYFPDPFLDDIKWWYLSKLGSSTPEIEGSFTDEIEPGLTEDDLDEETKKEISAVLLNKLKTQYQDYLSNPTNVPWDGVSREFYLAFGTFSGCYYDGASKEDNTHNDSLAIKLTVLPRILESNINATADGSPVTDLIRICSDASKEIEVTGKVDGVASSGYNWVWILKETGDILLENDPDGIFELKTGGKIPNEGTLIVTTDLKCTDSLEIPFKFYEPFTVDLEISSNVIGNELCLSSESGEEVVLTATIVPANREPEPAYYWYVWDAALSAFVEMPGNPATENTKEVLITEKGEYNYKVVAVDNICFTSHSATAGTNVDDNSFEAFYPVKIEKIESSSLRNDTVCVGDDLTFTATITNSKEGVGYEWYSSQDLTTKTGVLNGDETELTFTIKVEEAGYVELRIKDAICPGSDLKKNYYTFILVEDKEIKIKQADPVCLEPGKKTGETTISLEAPIAGAIKYEWYNEADELIGTTTAISQKVPLVSGNNTFYVKAIGECDELLSEETIIQANEQFTLDFKVTLDGDEIGDGSNLCLEGSDGNAASKEITLTATLIDPTDGATRTFYWYKWQDGADPVKIAETTSNTKVSSTTDNITDNGNYKYKVEVADGGVCYSPVGADINVTENDNADTTTFKARKPLKVDFSLNSLYCEDGRTETIKAVVSGYTDPADLGEIIYTWYINGTAQPATAAEYALTIKDGDKVRVEINDIVCGKTRSSAEKTVIARNPLRMLDLGSDLSIDTCALDSPKICFNITPSVSQAWTYQWEVLNESSEIIKENKTENPQNCMIMPLGRNGKVRVYAYDELCETNSDSATINYSIRDSISIELKVKDLEGNIISEGLMCMDSVILEASVLAGGTTGGYTWTWFDDGSEVKKEPVLLDQPAQRKIKLTPELLTYTITAAKEGECDHQDNVQLGTNLIPTEIDVNGRGPAFCSTEEPLELEVIVSDQRITDLSNIDFEWKVIRENGEEILLGRGNSVSYPLPSYDRFMMETIQVTATYNNRGDNICVEPNTEKFDFSVRRPLQIETPDNNAEYNICLDEPYREITLTVNVLDGRPDSIYWYKNDLLDTVAAVNGFDVITRIVRVSNSETYTAMVKDEVCGIAKGDSEIEVSVTHKPGFELIIDPDVIEITENTRLTAVITPDAEANSPYIWSNDIGWRVATDENQVTSDWMSQEGFYTFSVTTTVGHCTLEDDADLEVLELINNIITPYDRNGQNDVFMGPKNRRPGYKVEIFNRYQQRVFEGDNGWPGTYSNRDGLVEPGTYFYRIIMKSGRIMKGTVEVAKF